MSTPTLDPVQTPPAEAPVASRAGGRWQRVQLIALLGALSAFAPLSIDMYLPAFPDLTDEFGTSASLVQLTLSACLLGLATGQVLAGPLSDRFGRRRPLLVGLAAYAVTSTLCALAPSIGMLIALRYVQGVTGAAGIVIARAIVRDLYVGPEAARFFSRLMIVSGLAPILAPVLGGQVLRFTSWRGVFLVLAVIGGLLCLAAATRLPETLPPERRQEGGIRTTLGTFAMLGRDRAFMGYALSIGLAGAALFSYISGSPFVFQEVHGVDAQWFSVIFGSVAFWYVLMGQINGRLVNRIALPRLLVRGLTASALGGSLFLLVVLLDRGGWLPLVPPLYLLIGSLGFILPNATALALTGYPRTAGSASAMLGLMQFAIGAAVAPLVGLGGEESALAMGFGVALCSASALGVYLVMSQRTSTANA